MAYNPEIHHRRSIRLKGYDYSREGLYFITICVQDRKYLFGKIVVGAPLRGRLISESEKCGYRRMILNDAGKMVERWYRELENKYPDKRCHEMVIMPNHFHCIIENMGGGSQLDNDSQSDNGLQLGGGSQMGAHVGAPLRGYPIIDENGHTNDIEWMDPDDEKYGLHNKKYNGIIGNLVDWFKTMTTNEYIRGVKQYGWKRFDGKLWQRNYYEHIIRSTAEYERIADYINDNPAKWQDDRFFE